MSQTESGLNLTKTAYFGRQTVKYGIILLVLFMVGRTSFTAFVAYWKATHPAPPPPPTVGFGLLPAINFPVKDASAKPTSYRLETPTGGVPYFADRAKVFLANHSTPSLLDDEKAKKVGAAFNFVFAPEVLSGNLYRFNKSNPLMATFEYNSVTNHVTLTADFFSRLEVLTNKKVPDQSSAINTVRAVLSAANLFKPDLDTANAKVTYLKVLGTSLEPALSFTDAQIAQIDINRISIDNDYNFYTPDGNKGIISALVTGAYAGADAILKLDSNYQEIDYSQVHTYPLRDTQEAWNLMQAGEGYVAQKGEFDTAVVREVYMGYYDDTQQEDYVQPIYVFIGDGGFIGYVSALDPQYTQIITQP